jgi:lactoylglutathione lyase
VPVRRGVMNEEACLSLLAVIVRPESSRIQWSDENRAHRLWTDDLERLAAFYQTYFGGTVGNRYANPVKGFESRFLSFDAGARIEIMRTTTPSPVRVEPAAQRMGLTHIAVSVGSEQRVDELTSWLRADGYAVVDEPRRTGDGYYESVVLDPDGNRVEITV